MRNFILISVMTVFAFSLKAQETMVISWLPTNEARVNAYGSNAGGNTFTAVMEFYVEDLINFNSTNKAILGIEQVQFYLDSAAISAITNCNVVILQGKDINTTTEVVRQSLPANSWVKHWNIIDLEDVYDIDFSQRLYIGYEVTTSRAAYPLSVATGSNVKQGVLRVGTGNFQYLTSTQTQHVFLIKAQAIVDDSPEDEIALNPLSFDRVKMKGDSIEIKGTVKNLGQRPLTSFNVVYEVEGVPSAVRAFSGLNVQPNATYNFTHSDKLILSDAKFYDIAVIVSEPNGNIDIEGNNIQNAGVLVYEEKLQRTVLHETFTSSTCPPCKPGNEVLMNILKAQDASKWVCIKYQYNFPGTGDPYYTSECGARGSFYGGINGVPDLYCDGTMNMNPQSYTATRFNILANVPAASTMTGSATVANKTVSLNVTINPALTYDNPNLRFFATIIEKETFNNRKTNGETVFHYVMKKFMTSINGDTIEPLVLNTPISLDYSYTFNGNYRLPPTGQSSLINHATEHSVEDFQALMVVYWLQDIVTKEVYQAGKADPNPNYTSRVSVEEIAFNSNIRIYPNPAKDNVTISATEPIKEVTIQNLLGQKVSSYNGNVTAIPVSELANGMYIITIKTENGVFNQKFIKE